MMAESTVFSEEIEHLVTRLIGDGMLDDQFRQLMRLQNDSNPEFLKEVVELFFLESKRRLDGFAMLLGEAPQFPYLDQQVRDFKGSSASFGAKLVTDLCDTLRLHCQEGDLELCRETLGKQKEALSDLEGRMNTFLR